MSPTFEFTKGFDEVKDAPSISDGVYKMALNKAPYQSSNNAGTGMNIILELVITPDEGDAAGIQLNYYLPMPNETDQGKKTRSGQSMVDWKMQRAKDVAEALGGGFKGSKLDIPDSALCKAKVVNRVGDEGRTFLQIEGDLMSVKGAGGKRKS